MQKPLFLNPLGNSKVSNILIYETHRIVTNSDILGTVYLFNNFQNVSIITADDNTNYRINNFNIDLYNDLFISKIDDQTVFQFLTIKKAMVKNMLFVKIKGKIYRQLIKNNNLSFYKKTSKILKNEKINPMTNQVMRKSSWEIRNNYFISFNDENLIKFNLNKKSFLKLFDKTLQAKLKKDSKEQNISFNTEEGIVKLIHLTD